MRSAVLLVAFPTVALLRLAWSFPLSLVVQDERRQTLRNIWGDLRTDAKVTTGFSIIARRGHTTNASLRQDHDEEQFPKSSNARLLSDAKATRRQFVGQCVSCCLAMICGPLGSFTAHAISDDNENHRVEVKQSTVMAVPEAGSDDAIYQKQTDKFGYAFQVPSNFEAPSKKPLPTHLDEVNFKSANVPGYQYGITVDPVRISSLAQFGTPEEVAAKVVLAEVNRDGVFEVTLMEDPMAAPNNAYYILNYLSTGKRGDKRFVTKFYIQNQMLYALTAQCKEADYPTIQDDIRHAVESFRVI